MTPFRGKLANLTGQAEIASIGGKVHSFDYTTVLNGFSARMPYGDIEAAMELDGVSRIFLWLQLTSCLRIWPVRKHWYL